MLQQMINQQGMMGLPGTQNRYQFQQANPYGMIPRNTLSQMAGMAPQQGLPQQPTGMLPQQPQRTGSLANIIQYLLQNRM